MDKAARKGPLAVIFLTVLIDLLGFGMVIPLLPVYAEQFTVDESGLVIGLLMASFSAMQFLFAPMWGRLSDRIGRRPVLLIGLFGSTLFYIVFGVATQERSLFWLFASRIGAGICGATISTAQAYIADVTPLEGRAKGMALVGAAFGLGFTFGPLVGAAALLGSGDVGLSPWPGYVAAMLSGSALMLALFKLPESLRPGAPSAGRQWFAISALRAALTVPSVGILIVTLFVCVFSFANLESTLSLLLKSGSEGSSGEGFGLAFHQVLLVFAYIGVILSFAQGFLVRRLADRLPEGVLATTGAVVSIVGFLLVAYASRQSHLGWLLGALAIEVTGFAFMPPSLHSLISRRSDPAQQGGILGVAQSTSALARIAGPIFGITLFYVGAILPFLAAAGLMVIGLVLVGLSAFGSHDYGSIS